ncbi:unnamed protein product [Dicrocoelium dendriticum]|nr:unnamed protein product [Dicrocoelium dendriticum]
MRSYSTVGDFTALARLRSALLDNVVYYASYSAILIFILIYLLAKKTIVFDLSYLKVLLITAANTWGLFLVVLFLGYGLIEVPRSLWIAGKPIASLHRAYFVLNQKSVELADEEEKLREIIWKVDYLKTRLPVSHPLQPHVLVVYKQAHDSQTISLSYSALEQSFLMTDIDERLRKSIDCGSLNLKQLVRLHKSLKTTQYRWGRAQALYEEAVYAALRMEDMNEFRSKRFPPSATQGSVPGSSASRFAQLFFQIHRYWFCYLRLWSLQLLAVLLTFASIFLIWSECTFSIRSPTLSLVALVLKAEAKAQDFYLLEICSFLILGYLSFAVFFAVFRLRIFNYYRLVGSHHTDENSLLFCGALLCRLTPSLCLNFLGLAHMDSHLSRDDTPSTTPVDPATSASSIGSSVANVETAYTQFMGHLDVIPFIAKGFNIYFPIIILLLCVVSFFRLADRLLHHLGIPQLLDSSEYGSRRGRNPLVDDAILEGRLLLRKERMVLSRRARTSSGRSSSGPKLLGVSRNPFHVSDETSGDRASLLRDADKHGLQSPPRRTLFHEPPIEYSEASINDQFSLHLNP